MRPVIGITQCVDDRGRWRPGRTYGYLDAGYADAVDRAGGLPLLIPTQSDARAAVARIDGLVVPGGDDFAPPDPGRYAGVEFDVAPDRQLAFDRAVLDAASARALPVLAICYGMQLLSLARGGALHYHLPADVPGAQAHRLPEPDGRHALEVGGDTRLAEILGPGPHRVNSLHHQAVATPGDGLRACATAPDGVVEAIEAEDRGAPFLLGVQWHPEKLPEPGGDRLFAALVAACR